MKSKIILRVFFVFAFICMPIPSIADPLVIVKRGMAGGKHRNNVYEFELKEEIKDAVIKMWVRGLDGPDSYGTVEVVDPNGKTHRAYSWTPTKLKKASKDISNPSFKNAYFIEFEADEIINEAGRYRVSFKYKRGARALIIEKVEIATGRVG